MRASPWILARWQRRRDRGGYGSHLRPTADVEAGLGFDGGGWLRPGGGFRIIRFVRVGLSGLGRGGKFSVPRVESGRKANCCCAEVDEGARPRVQRMIRKTQLKIFVQIGNLLLSVVQEEHPSSESCG